MDESTAFLDGRSEEWGMAEKVLRAIRMEVKKKCLNCRSRKEEKKGRARSLEEKFQECSKGGGMGLATSVERPRVDSRTRRRKLGAKEKARRKRCDVRFCISRRNRLFQKRLLRMGLVHARSWERTGSRHLADKKVEVKTADGGSSRQERLGFVISFSRR